MVIFIRPGGIAAAKSRRMYPLLVNAIAATAGNLIDRWAQARAPKAAAPSVPFQQMLEGASAPAKSAAAATIERLRSELLSSPELRLALDSADPAHPATLQLSPDGTITAQTPGHSPQVLALSPETAAAARSLASFISPPASAFAGNTLRLNAAGASAI